MTIPKPAFFFTVHGSIEKCLLKKAAFDLTIHLIVKSVEKSWYHGHIGWPQLFYIVFRLLDF